MVDLFGYSLSIICGDHRVSCEETLIFWTFLAGGFRMMQNKKKTSDLKKIPGVGENDCTVEKTKDIKKLSLV